MRLEVGGHAATYSAAAVVFNDGAHWWADMMAAGHYKRRMGADGVRRPAGCACYRYDGLECDGRLRFCGFARDALGDDPRLRLQPSLLLGLSCFLLSGRPGRGRLPLLALGLLPCLFRPPALRL